MPTFTTGDTSPNLSGTLKSGTPATPVNLVGATLAVHVKKPDRTVLTLTGTAVDAAAGTWTAAWGGADLAAKGSWSVQVQVTYSNGKIQTFGPETFYVQDQFA